ncbi:uncharacterized protein [Amphiura filiformis]|uniref:uncharacterized protein n=1 Tax=Amphiura filiformis TaxID=82378 RepID=UPI003B220C48
MKSFTIKCLTFLSALTFALACQPPDCDRPDCGSCGNACCTLKFTLFNKSPKEAYNDMTKALTAGGADGRYTFIAGSDNTKYNISCLYQIQGWHTTLEHHYNDTLNFSIYGNPDGPASSSLVTAFSISQIAGALCDAGQNYKNLVGYFKGLKIPYARADVFGCQNPNP